MSEFRANSFALKKKENDAAYAPPDVLIKLSKWLQNAHQFHHFLSWFFSLSAIINLKHEFNKRSMKKLFAL